MKQKLAIIGSGIAGMGLAWFLRRDFELTVFEADSHVGGHANTVEAKGASGSFPVDTGFMVFNRVTYPNLVRLFEVLEVPTDPTDMSFSVQHLGRGLEYCGSSLTHLFVQRRNLLKPSFYHLLYTIDLFNREAVQLLDDPCLENMSLSDYVHWRGYSSDLLELYLVPMSSAVWSTPPESMLKFPARTLLRFFHNHGFLGLHTQHPWWTVRGGSKSYVQRLTAPFADRIRLNTPVKTMRRHSTGIELQWEGGSETFDDVVFACHPPASLAIMGSTANLQERRLLSAFQFQPNETTLHTDASVMPKRKGAWASWNYRTEAPSSSGTQEVSTHYWMTRLQNLSDPANWFVSINGRNLSAPETQQLKIAYEHPLFDLAAILAQREMAELNKAARTGSHTYFAGAWQRYGFHEDGLLSAVTLAETILGRDPWLTP